MEISSPQIEANINALQSQVNEYDTNSSGIVSKLKFRTAYLYIAIPIAIFIVLAIWRPGFVRQEEKLQTGETQLKTSMKKILMWSLILGGVIVVGVYAITRKMSR